MLHDLPSYVSLRDIQGISDNDFYFGTIYSQSIVQEPFGHPQCETNAVKQPNTNSITSSNFSSSPPSLTVSPRLSTEATHTHFGSSPAASTKSPHLSSSAIEGKLISSFSASIEPTPELASPASQSSNQEFSSPLQIPVTTEAITPSNPIPIDAVHLSIAPGNFSGRSKVSTSLQNRSLQYTCDHCPKVFPRRCDLKYVTQKYNFQLMLNFIITGSTQTFTPAHISVASHLAKAQALLFTKIYAAISERVTKSMKGLSVPIPVVGRHSLALIIGKDML
ncbi:hypothetical protein NHQ30_007396 [Ciborinia camelliae]|nr:hypothetical protein NHQ30_007396 [Ciborinia camelliae]